MKFLLNLLRPVWRVINGIRKVLLNVIFFALLIGIIAILMQDDPLPEVPDGGLLVLNPSGMLVEEKTHISPADRFFAEAFGGGEMPEVQVRDLTRVIDAAAEDDKVGGLVLDLRNLWGSGISKLRLVGHHLEKFKESGKPIYAVGDNYTQSQYLLATYADDIYLHNMGGVSIEGFKYYRMYYADLLDKLSVKPRIFRVGTYKSAVEPFLRNDMSEEDKEAASLWLNDLWGYYLGDISSRRTISDRMLSGSMDDFLAALEETDFSFAEAALNNGLVDHLATREEMRQALIDAGGFDSDKETYRHITFRDYHRILEKEQAAKALRKDDRDQIRVVVGRGTILDGSRSAGEIGGDSMAAELRKARLDDNVKAVVMRVDSPGGSAFASEIIREEVKNLRAAGKPVVASMSDTAASGGYWIASGADAIVATPTTITGSIGVFGMFLTLDQAMERIGVNVDGFGTTEFPLLDGTQPIDDKTARVIQGSIDHIYEDFLVRVAEERELSLDEVREVAEGRVWSGAQAFELGLVDQLGEIHDAIALASEFAEIENYRVTWPTRELSPFEQFLSSMFNGVQAIVPNALLPGSKAEVTPTVTDQLMYRAWQEAKVLNEFNDPNGIYTRCMNCPVQ